MLGGVCAKSGHGEKALMGLGPRSQLHSQLIGIRSEAIVHSSYPNLVATEACQKKTITTCGYNVQAADGVCTHHSMCVSVM